jgi:hypothetical protein
MSIAPSYTRLTNLHKDWIDFVAPSCGRLQKLTNGGGCGMAQNCSHPPQRGHFWTSLHNPPDFNPPGIPGRRLSARPKRHRLGLAFRERPRRPRLPASIRVQRIDPAFCSSSFRGSPSRNIAALYYPRGSPALLEYPSLCIFLAWILVGAVPPEMGVPIQRGCAKADGNGPLVIFTI